MSSVYPLRYPGVLFGLFAIVFVTLGISPASRQQWLLGNVPVLLMVAALLLTTRRFRFTKGSYTYVFLLLILLEIGAHYTDWLVPFEQLSSRTTGLTPEQLFGGQRGVYQPMIYFGYGILLLPPTMELMRSYASPRGWWRWVQAPLIVLAFSALCELLKGVAALLTGNAFAPGNTQADMAYAFAGALFSQLLIHSDPARSAEH